jgi:hypothetical protein
MKNKRHLSGDAILFIRKQFSIFRQIDCVLIDQCSMIKDEWITFVIQNYEKIVIQADVRIIKWAKITEAGKFFRVILLEDGETFHNAFFDRSFDRFSGEQYCSQNMRLW